MAVAEPAPFYDIYSEMIKFSQQDIDAKEQEYVIQSLCSGVLSGDGPFTRHCCELLQARLGAPVLLTHSGTAALEMAALLLDLKPGDEVIMPSFTFSSTANAVVLRGATPVFIDVRPETLNMDERLLNGALSSRTRAIFPVHYGGVACDMDAINAFAASHGLAVVEDAAQAHLAFYKGKPLGTLSALGCISFHVTKNIVSGEGGALILNDPMLRDRAYLLAEKGTNRREFLRGEAGRYEWLDVGSSYLPSDILAALLLAQLERDREMTARRVAIWNRYHQAFADAQRRGLVRRAAPPDFARHNGHLYFLVLPDADAAARLRDDMKAADIPCPHHYVPLHSAPAGRRFGRAGSDMRVTERDAPALLRLPLHSGMTDNDADRVTEELLSRLNGL